MLTYLSPSWVEALDRALAGVEPPAGLAPVVVQFVVTALGEGAEGAADVAYHLDLSAAGVRARPGHHPAPHVTFTQSRTTAAEVAAGARSSQASVLRGDVVVGGDAAVLVPWRRVLADGVDAALRDLNARTDLGVVAPAPPAAGT